MTNARGDLKDLLLGQVGKDILAGSASSPAGARYCCLHAISASVISAMTDATVKNGTPTFTLAAGDNYYGDISAVTITSGTLVCYYL